MAAVQTYPGQRCQVCTLGEILIAFQSIISVTLCTLCQTWWTVHVVWSFRPNGLQQEITAATSKFDSKGKDGVGANSTASSPSTPQPDGEGLLQFCYGCCNRLLGLQLSCPHLVAIKRQFILGSCGKVFLPFDAVILFGRLVKTLKQHKLISKLLYTIVWCVFVI